ncbi:Crp/Fnr family transcriptional regulator [Paenibacillus sp. CN-4]|uniref:Crp/Fnr family transcriptional regulator n=1 Tax=Paenibacillus nanchangensis TaxID=3348343 RepID=UPI003978DDEE
MECGHCQTGQPGASKTQQLCVSLVPIFNHLESEQMQEIAGTTRQAVYARNQPVYQAGDTLDRLYIVHTGKVRIYRITESGKEQLLRILEPGDFMGEHALFAASTADHYAEAMEQTELCIMSRKDLQVFLLKYPAIALKLLEAFGDRLERLEKHIGSLTSEGTERRLAAYLLELAGEGGEETVTLPIPKKDLASYLGTTPETVSRKLAEFQEKGWIEQTGQRGIRIVNAEALRST